jgi:serine/threonine kinase 16
MINANLVNHTKFPEKRLMQLFLGVCKALKAMHQYKVGGAPGGGRSQGKARRVREQAEEADRQAASEAGADEDEAAEGLLEAEGEITRSQVGHAPGQVRAYAHRDIKPGTSPSSITTMGKMLIFERKHYDSR